MLQLHEVYVCLIESEKSVEFGKVIPKNYQGNLRGRLRATLECAERQGLSLSVVRLDFFRPPVQILKGQAVGGVCRVTGKRLIFSSDSMKLFKGRNAGERRSMLKLGVMWGRMLSPAIRMPPSGMKNEQCPLVCPGVATTLTVLSPTVTSRPSFR